MRILVVVLMLCVGTQAFSQKKAAPDAFDAYLQQRMQADSIPGLSLLIAHKGKPVKTASMGFSSLEHQAPAGQQTVYELASVSKPITATALMLLVEQGRVSLDSSIAVYLGSSVPDSYRPVTVRRLMSHTAGILSDHYTYTKLYAPTPLRYTTRDQLTDLFAMQPMAAPGEKYLYSNAGFFLQAAIIEAVTGQTYQQFMQQQIFDKAGMHHSYFINGDSIVAHHAQGYTKRKGRLVRFSLEGTIQALNTNGFGGLMSTTGDLQAWITALLQGKLISTATLRQMLQPTLLNNGKAAGPKNHPATVGLGWHVKTIAGKQCMYHTGHTGTALLCFPEEELTIVLLSNLTAGYSMFGDKGYRVADVGFELAEMAAKQYLK
jgi:CubicO group peptidase (beta-lactamase class C family)